MSEFAEEFTKELTKRTKANYMEFKNTEYEVTLLLNSAVGMLIIPNEKHLNRFSDEKIDAQLMGKLRDCVKSNTYSGEINLRFIAKHTRNAITHGRIRFKPKRRVQRDKPREIDTIIFEDRDYDKNKEKNERSMVHCCKIEMSVKMLETFFLAISDIISEL